MLRKKLRFKKWLALSIPLCFATYVGAQSSPAQNPSTSNNDNGRGDIASFDQFLDSHREIAEQLRRQPSLADNKQFLKDHPALQSYLQRNPSVRERLEQNPNAFMGQEAYWEHSGDDRTADLDARYDRDRNNNAKGYDRNRHADRDRDAQKHFGEFLGSHQDIAAQLSRNPSLCKDHAYLQTTRNFRPI